MVEPDYPEMNESIDKISLYAPGGYNFAVETPQESRMQNAHDVETGMSRAKKLVTLDFAFPGSTQSDEGDPLKVSLLTDADLPMGSLLRCRVLGGIAGDVSSGEPPNSTTAYWPHRSCCTRRIHHMSSPTCH